MPSSSRLPLIFFFCSLTMINYLSLQNVDIMNHFGGLHVFMMRVNSVVPMRFFRIAHFRVYYSILLCMAYISCGWDLHA